MKPSYLLYICMYTDKQGIPLSAAYINIHMHVHYTCAVSIHTAQALSCMTNPVRRMVLYMHCKFLGHTEAFALIYSIQ